ncbi:ThuA domain-containing protein [Curtobacterium sp. A7_M15]|uniref:ThuA domain-containing protein n=1 Tax=Curtobacterium sp. A7_M15 TaxID=3065241 RepID=UPI002737FEC7|nr:ThuA domain-containing protein [Curtobacterium sp. A7_M15]MDP4332717.1 ThuA domain-containing protein [Curtobacterium sp. A7_M15]
MTAVLLGGVGRWTDPWHPFAETTAALTAIAAEAGIALSSSPDVDRTLESFRDGPLPSLVVVDLGLPRDGLPVPLPAADPGFRRMLGSRVPMLAVHVSSTSFAGDDDWERALGGVWVRGGTMHPPAGPCTVHVVDDQHPVTAGLGDFSLDDERYSHQRVSSEVRVLVDHEHDGLRHPLVWVHDRPGGGVTVYDGLGHSGASFASPEHRRLVAQALRFLVAPSS